MKSVDQHLADVLEGLETLSPLELQLLDAQGCTLEMDVATTWALPPFDNSSMDGYAVRAEDAASASESDPVVLPVVGDIAAGSSSAVALVPGQTARIMTGAPVPSGADAVVPVEWTDGGVANVRITRAPKPGAYIRRRGEDAPEGTVVLTKGTRLGPAQLGLLGAVGRDRVLVRPRPRVVVLSTGDELVEPGTSLAPGRIPDSNSFMLAAAARESGAMAYRVGFVSDDPRVLMDTLEDQLIRADLVTHHRRRQRRRLRRGQGGIEPAGHGVLRQGRHATGDAAGVRPRRSGPDADPDPAGEPGLGFRVLRGLRAPGPASDAWRRAAAPPHGAGGADLVGRLA